MSDTTPTASDEHTRLAEEQSTPLADETARDLDTGEQLVQPSSDPADQTDTAVAPTLPPDYRPVSASEHVAPEPAVPAASSAAEVTPTADTAAADTATADTTTARATTAAPIIVTPPAEPTAVAEPAPTPAPTAVAEPAPAPAPAVAAAPAPYAGATYLTAPTPPKKKGNRGLGILIAVLAALVFAGANAAATFGILSVDYGTSRAQTYLTSYLQGWEFWVPVAVFTAAFIALVAIVNRGRWWAYIVGSAFVAALVFVSYFAAALLTLRVWERTHAEFRSFADSYFGTNIPYLWVAVAASFIALEVVIWFGGWIAFHGQNAKRRYVEAKAAYDAEHRVDR